MSGNVLCHGESERKIKESILFILYYNTLSRVIKFPAIVGVLRISQIKGLFDEK